jgi:hypothetical protein
MGIVAQRGKASSLTGILRSHIIAANVALAAQAAIR